jgi:isopenicillin N synthase-like dioxygenase
MTDLIAAPVVDVAALRTELDKGAAATVAALDAACRDTGFFVIVNHGLDEPLADTFAAARAFFARPDEAKAAVTMIGLDGYIPIGSARSGPKEMYDIGRRGGIVGDGRWPDVPGFAATIERYQDAALALAGDLLRGLAVALELDGDFFADRMRDPQCFLRLLHAPARPGATDTTTGAHTDYGAITLLATDGVAGLEVLPLGRDWQPVMAPPGALVVNLGDMLARWTNDRYASTPHRVMPGPEERFSIPFFVNPDPDTVVTCLPSCVDDDHPCGYDPITATDFLQGRIDGTIPSGNGRHG